MSNRVFVFVLILVSLQFSAFTISATAQADIDAGEQPQSSEEHPDHRIWETKYGTYSISRSELVFQAHGISNENNKPSGIQFQNATVVGIPVQSNTNIPAGFLNQTKMLGLPSNENFGLLATNSKSGLRFYVLNAQGVVRPLSRPDELELSNRVRVRMGVSRRLQDGKVYTPVSINYFADDPTLFQVVAIDEDGVYRTMDFAQIEKGEEFPSIDQNGLIVLPQENIYGQESSDPIPVAFNLPEPEMSEFSLVQELARYDKISQIEKSRALLPWWSTPIKSASGLEPFSGLTDAVYKDEHGNNSSSKEVIERFTEDLRYKFSQKPLPDYMQISQDLKENIYRSILQNEKGSVALLGDAGVGKTTAADIIASEIASGKCPEALKNYQVLKLDITKLMLGMREFAMDKKIAAILQMSRHNKIIWVIDEFHNLRGKGTHSNDSNDIFENLKTDLADGNLRVLGLTTKEEFNSAYASDSAVKRRIDVHEMQEPTGEELRQKLRSWRKFHDLPTISDELLDDVIALSNEYIAVGAQPDKAKSLMDYQAADAKLHNKPQEVPTLADFETMTVKKQHLPEHTFDGSSVPQKLERLRQQLDETVVGYNQTKTRIVNEAKQILLGLNDSSKPRFLMGFFGKEGRGKTEMAKATAAGLGLPYEEINMEDYASPTTHRERLMERIAKILTKNSQTVLIFNEIEKAHMSVQAELLSYMTNGIFNAEMKEKGSSDKYTSVKVDGRHASIIWTSNAVTALPLSSARSSSRGTVSQRHYGFMAIAESFVQQPAPSSEASHPDMETIKAMASEHNMSSVFLDRSEMVAFFDGISRDEFKQAVQLHLNRVLSELGTRKKMALSFENQEGFTESVAQKVYSPNMSNRRINEVLKESVRDVIADALMSHPGDKKLELVFDGTRVRLKDDGDGPGKNRPSLADLNAEGSIYNSSLYEHGESCKTELSDLAKTHFSEGPMKSHVIPKR